MDIFDLQARIGIDTSEYDKKVDNSSKKFTSFGEGLKKGLSNVGSLVTSALSTVASGVQNMASSMVSATADLANYGDNIDKASQKIGISAQAYQEWEAVMQHSGTSMDSMSVSFKTLANASQGATDAQAEAFEKLGLSMDQVSSMSTEDLFASVISGLQGMEEGTERTALATSLLGKGAMELGPLLNTSAEDTQAMIDAVNELGGVMSDDAVKASASFNDALQDMQTAIDGVKRGVVAEFLPGLTKLMDGFTALITGSDDAGEKLTEGFESIADGINKNISKVVEVTRTILPKMIDTIVSTLPGLIDTAADIVETLADAIFENLPVIIRISLNMLDKVIDIIKEYAPTFIDASFDLVFALIDGIIEMLPDIVNTAVDIVVALVDKLTDGDTLDMLIDTGITLIMTLTEALIDNLPKLIVKAPIIIDRLVKAISNNVPKLLEASWEIIQMLWHGLEDNLPYIIESGKEILNSLVNGVVEMFTKLEPLAKDIINKIGHGIDTAVGDATKWGKDLMDNFIGGIKEKWEALKNTVSDVAQSVKDFLGFSEPKEGPLSNFHTYAPDMMDLFAEGIKDNTKKITSQLQSSLSDVSASFETEIDVNPKIKDVPAPENRKSDINSNGAGSYYKDGVIININISSETIGSDYDAYRTAQKISEELARLQSIQNIATGG